MPKELNLAELICTRLCHDLAGPIGAVRNGSELLEEDGDMAKQAFQLIQSSASNAVSKLMFFRNIYGRLNFSGEADLEECRQLALGYLVDSKVKLDWPDEHVLATSVSVGKKIGRVILLMILVASESLVKGGDLLIRITGNAESSKVEVIAKGAMVKFEKEDGETLEGNADLENLIPKKAPILLIHELVKSSGYRISFSHNENELKLVVDK